ncbi:DUF5050 domain-containing protein [Lachnoclostridium phytofermentans]|uniref:DUF5050 domain-containing protein n=1 Tax=Lachnoclostridium phytofermentans TaxID=66219 RepID=UPI000497F5CD|nr:DUF5050 domain-containing protein [Lachnoclostridium phytofermentans]
MKKKISVILLLMMLFSMITGCNGERNILENETSTSTQIIDPIKSPQDNDSEPTKIPNNTGENITNEPEAIGASSESSLQTNFVYGGKVASDGSYQYFELITFADSIVGLCRTEKNGKNFSVLDNCRVESLNLRDEFLYYIQSSESRYGGDIYRINKDGSEKTVLLKGNYCQLMIIENKLYFLGSDDYKIYRMNLEGSGLEVFISDECDIFLYSDGYIYSPILEKGTEGREDLILAKYDIKDASKRL